MMGININCRRHGFIDQILIGEKTVETRGSHSLRPYVGQVVGLIQTGTGRATLRGWARIASEIRYDLEGFRADFDRHQVAAGSDYDIKNGVKWGYVLEDVTTCDPVPVFSRGIIARRLEF